MHERKTIEEISVRIPEDLHRGKSSHKVEPNLLQELGQTSRSHSMPPSSSSLHSSLSRKSGINKRARSSMKITSTPNAESSTTIAESSSFSNPLSSMSPPRSRDKSEFHFQEEFSRSSDPKSCLVLSKVKDVALFVLWDIHNTAVMMRNLQELNIFTLVSLIYRVVSTIMLLGFLVDGIVRYPKFFVFWTNWTFMFTFIYFLYASFLQILSMLSKNHLIHFSSPSYPFSKFTSQYYSNVQVPQTSDRSHAHQAKSNRTTMDVPSTPEREQSGTLDSCPQVEIKLKTMPYQKERKYAKTLTWFVAIMVIILEFTFSVLYLNSFIVAVFFWTLVFKPTDDVMNVSVYNFVSHGVTHIMIFIELFLNSCPIDRSILLYSNDDLEKKNMLQKNRDIFQSVPSNNATSVGESNKMGCKKSFFLFFHRLNAIRYVAGGLKVNLLPVLANLLIMSLYICIVLINYLITGHWIYSFFGSQELVIAATFSFIAIVIFLLAFSEFAKCLRDLFILNFGYPINSTFSSCCASRRTAGKKSESQFPTNPSDQQQQHHQEQQQETQEQKEPSTPPHKHTRSSEDSTLFFENEDQGDERISTHDEENIL